MKFSKYDLNQNDKYNTVFVNKFEKPSSIIQKRLEKATTDTNDEESRLRANKTGYANLVNEYKKLGIMTMPDFNTYDVNDPNYMDKYDPQKALAAQNAEKIEREKQDKANRTWGALSPMQQYVYNTLKNEAKPLGITVPELTDVDLSKPDWLFQTLNDVNNKLDYLNFKDNWNIRSSNARIDWEQNEIVKNPMNRYLKNNEWDAMWDNSSEKKKWDDSNLENQWNRELLSRQLSGGMWNANDWTGIKVPKPIIPKPVVKKPVTKNPPISNLPPQGNPINNAVTSYIAQHVIAGKGTNPPPQSPPPEESKTPPPPPPTEIEPNTKKRPGEVFSPNTDRQYSTGMVNNRQSGKIELREKKTRMSTTKKFMGGKSGRMGPLIDDGIGEKGRYFEKGKTQKSQSRNAIKFYETDKTDNVLMSKSMKKAIGQMAQKFYEINAANYYGNEKPKKANSIRKDGNIGGSVNIGGAMNNYVAPNQRIPSKQMYSLDTPRQKTPTPMGTPKTFTPQKPMGGSLNAFNPYPRSGSMATGMGAPTMKRMTFQKTVTRLSQSSLPQGMPKPKTVVSRKYR
jgi:hypothetical protein